MDSPENPQLEPLTKSRSRLLAICFSLLIPGTGLWFMGAKKLAVGEFASFLLCISLFWPFRVVANYPGLITSAWLICSCFAISAISTLRVCRNGVRGQWGWVALLVPAALGVVSLYMAPLSRISGFRLFSVPSTSMQNTILKGDHIWVDLWAYKTKALRRNDVVITYRQGLWQVRRLSALPGDTLELRNDVVLLNGVAQDEPYVIHTRPGVNGDPPELHNLSANTIPSGSAFVMGDNRDISLDSRMAEVGLLNQSDVKGRVLFVVRGNSLFERQGVPVH